ncbi:MAG: DNA cytosine methyltransferase, partial [Candidatus Dojkabacteria bacterium]
GLWFEMLRVISEIRPAFVVAENVRGAINLALDTVQAGMEAEDYTVRTLLLPAAAFGAPHKRERMFVFGIRNDVAHAINTRLQGCERASAFCGEGEATYEPASECGEGGGRLWPTPTSTERSGINPNTGSGAGLTHAVSLWRTPDANCMRGPSSEARMEWKREMGMPISINDQVAEVERGALWPTPCSRGNDGGGPIGLGGGARARRNLDERVGEDARKKLCSGSLNPAWVEILMGFPLGWTDIDCDEPEPWPGWAALMGKSQYPYEPPRTVTGCSNRAKRLKCLGNAVVPQQARPIFEAIRQIHNFITCECFT